MHRFWRRMTLIWAVAFGGWLLVYLLPAPSVTQVNGVLHYTTEWEWGIAAPLSSGGWQTTTDLGYIVHVVSGGVVNRAATANACPHTHNLLSWVVELLFPQTAHAGHSVDHDPARLYTSFVDDLAHPIAREWGSVTVPEPTYCEAHYLIAIADEGTLGGTDALQGSSLWVEADVTGADGSRYAFNIVTQQPWGALHPLTTLDGNRVHAVVSSEPVTIAFVRPLATLFDGIDFAGLRGWQRYADGCRTRSAA